MGRKKDLARRGRPSLGRIQRWVKERELEVSQVNWRMGTRWGSNRCDKLQQYRYIAWEFEHGHLKRDNSLVQHSLAVWNPRMQRRMQRGRDPDEDG